MDQLPSNAENMGDSASLNWSFFSFRALPSLSSSSRMSSVSDALKSKPTIFCAPSWNIRTFLLCVFDDVEDMIGLWVAIGEELVPSGAIT